MRKCDVPNHIDELLLNVLGGEFFRQNNIQAKFIPVLPKKIGEINRSLKDVS